MISSAMGVLAAVMLAGMVAAAYVQNGQAARIIAIPAFLAMLLSALGLYRGVKSTKEEDTYRFFPWFGCGVNGMVLAACVLTYILGW